MVPLAFGTTMITIDIKEDELFTIMPVSSDKDILYDDRFFNYLI